MPFLRQQERRTPVDERVRRHLEEKLKPAVSENFSAVQFVGTSRRSSSNQSLSSKKPALRAATTQSPAPPHCRLRGFDVGVPPKPEPFV